MSVCYLTKYFQGSKGKTDQNKANHGKEKSGKYQTISRVFGIKCNGHLI